MYMQRRIFRAWAHRNPLEETAPRAGPAALYQVRKWGPARGSVKNLKSPEFVLLQLPCYKLQLLP